MGGMIAQYLGIDHPDKVDRIVLAITLPKAEKQTVEILKTWIDMAKKGEDFKLIKDTMEKTYTEKTLRKYRLLYPLLKLFSKVKDPNRLIRQAEACINHNAWDELDKLNKPVLVLGGNEDLIAGNQSSQKLHERLPDSRLYIYEGYGHGVYEECKKDFEKKVFDFLS
jgi:pimeloyl-ACP methyl ester carboxylesterase